jgi:hypothetical protein
MRIRALPPLTRALQQQYWDIVSDCLVTLHGWSEERAKGATADLYRRVAALPDPYSLLLLYHTEPIDLAGNLSSEALDFSEHRATYETIVARHPADRVRVPTLAPRPEQRPA